MMHGHTNKQSRSLSTAYPPVREQWNRSAAAASGRDAVQSWEPQAHKANFKGGVGRGPYYCCYQDFGGKKAKPLTWTPENPKISGL